MSSQTDIINLALVALGDNTVVNINQPGTNANTLLGIYDTIRLAELRKRFWKFSLKKVQIASLANVTPPPPYQYAYQLPNDCLRLLDAGNTRQNLGMLNYRTGLEKLYDFLNGNQFVTQMPAPLWIHYLSNVTDTTLFDANFVVSLAYAIALAASYKITQSVQVRQKIKDDYKDAIYAAAMANAIERLPEGMADDSYVISRW